MSDNNKSTGAGGIGLGSVIAAVLSYSMWKSVGWAIVAAIFGWAYVLYYLITVGFSVGPNLP